MTTIEYCIWAMSDMASSILENLHCRLEDQRRVELEMLLRLVSVSAASAPVSDTIRKEFVTRLVRAEVDNTTRWVWLREDLRRLHENSASLDAVNAAREILKLARLEAVREQVAEYEKELMRAVEV